MTDRHGTDPDFSDLSTPGGDHTDPAGPFGRLLRDAFAPEISDAELAESAVPTSESTVWAHWQQRVMEPFSKRYRLWSADADGDRWAELVSVQIRKRWPHLSSKDADGIARELVRVPSWHAVAPAAAADAFVHQAEEGDAPIREHSAFQLAIHIEGASPDELLRGGAAAQAVFDAAGVTPAQAARSLFNRDGWDDRGFPEEAQPTETECQEASV